MNVQQYKVVSIVAHSHTYIKDIATIPKCHKLYFVLCTYTYGNTYTELHLAHKGLTPPTRFLENRIAPLAWIDRS